MEADAVFSAAAVLTSVAETVDGFAAALRAGRSGVRTARLPGPARVTVTAPVDEEQGRAAARICAAASPVLPSHALAHLDTDIVGAVSELTGATAEGYTIGGASASGTLALIHAARLLELDVADHCLVVGALSELSAAEYRAL